MKTKICKSKRTDQLHRIERNETLLRELAGIVTKPSPTEEELLKARDRAAELARYYESDDWKRDFADDEAGLLPKELPRGVLSEDGIYNALELCRECLDRAGLQTEEEAKA